MNAYNIILSQILLILYLSNREESAAHEIRLLIHTLVGNGFKAERLLQKLSQQMAYTTKSTFA